MHFEPHCDECGNRAAPQQMCCGRCGGALSFQYDLEQVSWDTERRGMLRYWRLLPVADPTAAVTLAEGGTPLVRARSGSTPEIWYKIETANPTGSHKDRQLSVALSHAVRVGARMTTLVSSGSTGLSNAAYSARAGLASVVCMTAGVPAERSYPVFALGSRVVEVNSPVDELIDLVTRLTAELGVYHSSTTRRCNPYQAEGAKTIAFEIVDDLGRAPDWLVVPVGGGGTIAAIGRGFAELQSLGRIERMPRLVGAVSARFDVLARAFVKGLSTRAELAAVPDRGGPATPVQAKLAHADPPDGVDALEAVRATGGRFIAVSDEAALAAQAEVGAGEGIYLEPSAGTAAAAANQLVADGVATGSDSVVAVLSGSGFRETGLTMRYRPRTPVTVDTQGLRRLFEER